MAVARPLTTAQFKNEPWHTYVTVWSRWPGDIWVVERSWALGYLRDSGWKGPKRRDSRGREYAIFPNGVNPNGAARKRRKEEPISVEDRTPLMKLAGISNEAAAKRDLKRRFRQEPLQPPVVRHGARFYVTARSGGRTAYLMGPYASHLSAQQAESTARRLLSEKYPEQGFVSVGTASRPDTVPTLFGHGQYRRKFLGRTADRAARRRGVR